MTEPINLTELRRDTEERPDHMPADIDKDSVLALIDAVEAAMYLTGSTETKTDRERLDTALARFTAGPHPLIGTTRPPESVFQEFRDIHGLTESS